MIVRASRSWFSALLVVGLLPSLSSAASATAWDPARTWVFLAGLVEWKDENTETFEKKGRQDTELAAAFKERGVPETQIAMLNDRKATRKACIDRLTHLLTKTQAGDMLVFYYAGHGGWDPDAPAGLTTFEAYDRSWSVDDALKLIERKFRGSRVLLLTDCCCSGGLADMIHKRKSRLQYACLCSVYKHNSSTENWTFTGCLAKGLRGNAEVDLDEDGAIDLEELARYAQLEMAFAENQKAVFELAHGFPRHLQLAPALPKTSLELGRRVEAERDGHWQRAKIESLQNGKYKVRYVPSNEREWVTAKQVRPFRPQHIATTHPVEVLDEEGFEGYVRREPSMPLASASEEPRWFAAKVVGSWYGMHHIRYEDPQMKWDEWVPHHRVRVRK
jgi:hypothetical protein